MIKESEVEQVERGGSSQDQQYGISWFEVKQVKAFSVETSPRDEGVTRRGSVYPRRRQAAGATREVKRDEIVVVDEATFEEARNQRLSPRLNTSKGGRRGRSGRECGVDDNIHQRDLSSSAKVPQVSFSSGQLAMRRDRK